MSSDSPPDLEERTYGELLGEYFEVAADISRLLDDFGRPRPDALPEYHDLRERKRELRATLSEVEEDHPTGDIEEILDRALSPE